MDLSPAYTDASLALDAPMVQCVVGAASRFSLPPKVLLAVLLAENGRAGQSRKNTNGSYDVGPMQVNSVQYPLFKGYVSPEQIKNDPCTNIHVGAWILKSQIIRRGDFWQGVGTYHSRTPARNLKYQQRVRSRLLQAGEILEGAMRPGAIYRVGG